MKKISHLLFSLTLIIPIILTSHASAQYGSYGSTDARSIGMGNTYTANAFNTLAIGKNPALLSYPKSEGGLISIQFPNFASRVFTNSISFDDLNYYFGGVDGKPRILTDEDKHNLYEAFSGDGNFFFNLTSKILTISWTPSRKVGSFALSVTDFASGNIILPKSFIDLLINGNQVDKEYSFNNLSFKSWWIRTYSLSYARDIFDSGNDYDVLKNISGGLTIKYVSGFEYAGTEKVDSYIHTGENNVLTGTVDMLAYSSFSNDLGVKYDFDVGKSAKQKFGYLMEPAGSGFGADLGFSAEFNNGIMLGIAVTDIGSITWNKNAAEHRTSGELFVDDLLNKAQLDSLIDFTNTDGKRIDEFNTDLPTAFRFGVAWELNKFFEGIPGRLITALDYNQGFNEMPANSTKPRISLGVLWHPTDYLPVITTGFSNDQTGSIRWAMGIGYTSSFFDFNISTINMMSVLTPNSGDPYVSAALNAVWRISYGREKK